MENLEEVLKELMERKSGSVRAFAIDNDIPYTTLRSMLERGVMATNVSNVITICRALNIKPESLDEDKLRFDFSKPIILGDNNGVTGTNNGNITFNSGTSKEQDKHNDSMKNLGVADLKLQRSLLNKLDKQITLAEETNILLTTLVEAEAENGRKLDLILGKINEL
ncbi:hypothetical protein [Streptococcus suis]|uniref:hypothetical protein n=1 Tax=Streptococcus suis TaxID=1307 RepID=UPI000CF71119|nr:hypothetical protein [Streptococcus suis]